MAKRKTLGVPYPRSLTIATHKSLKLITSTSGKGVYASGGLLFRGAVFGRDSLEVAEDLYLWRPKLARSIILTLASLQGLTVNTQSEEAPGKIPHEHRMRIVDGRELTDEERYIYEQLTLHWGESNGMLTYYGSVDSTPLFIRLVGKYVERYGKRLLNTSVTRKDGTIVSLAIIVGDAVRWLDTSINASPYGLLAYQRTNPRGIENQAWKDSFEFYHHSGGEQANLQAPIASVEVQGIAYDAYIYAAKLLDRPELKERAATLQTRMIELLWLPDENYFALGVDTDPRTGEARRITTSTANPAELLDTKVFDTLDPPARQTYITAITRKIFSKDFLTSVGIRSRALSMHGFSDFWDYHGSYVSWPKETFDIARGLRRQSLPKLARQLENRLLNITRRSQEYYEFYYVDAQGRVLLAPSEEGVDSDIVVRGSNTPMTAQAWTISAVLALKYPAPAKLYRKQFTWQRQLEKTVLDNIELMRPLRSHRSLEQLYPSYHYNFEQVSSWIDER